MSSTDNIKTFYKILENSREFKGVFDSEDNLRKSLSNEKDITDFYNIIKEAGEFKDAYPTEDFFRRSLMLPSKKKEDTGLESGQSELPSTSTSINRDFATTPEEGLQQSYDLNYKPGDLVKPIKETPFPTTPQGGVKEGLRLSMFSTPEAKDQAVTSLLEFNEKYGTVYTQDEFEGKQSTPDQKAALILRQAAKINAKENDVPDLASVYQKQGERNLAYMESSKMSEKEIKDIMKGEYDNWTQTPEYQTSYSQVKQQSEAALEQKKNELQQLVNQGKLNKDVANSQLKGLAEGLNQKASDVIDGEWQKYYEAKVKPVVNKRIGDEQTKRYMTLLKSNNLLSRRAVWTIDNIAKRDEFVTMSLQEKKRAIANIWGFTKDALIKKGYDNDYIQRYKEQFVGEFVERAYHDKESKMTSYGIKDWGEQALKELDERQKELESQPKSQQNRFVPSLGGSSSTFANVNDYSEDVRNELRDIMQAKEQIQNTLARPEKDQGTLLGGLKYGFVNEHNLPLPYLKTAIDLNNNINLYQAAKKAQEGKQLTEGEKFLLHASGMEETYKQNIKPSFGFGAGTGTAFAIPYLVDYLAGGWAAAPTRKAVAESIAKYVGKTAENALFKNTVTRPLSVIIGEVARTSSNPMGWAKATLDHLSPEIRFSLGGEQESSKIKNVRIGDMVAVLDSSTQNIDGSKTGKGMSPMEAFAYGFLDTYIENLTESLGGAFGVVGNDAVTYLIKNNGWAKRLYIGYMLKMNGGLTEGSVARTMNQLRRGIAKQTGNDGFFGENIEEYGAAVAQDFLYGRKFGASFNEDFFKETAAVTGLIQVPFATIGIGAKAIDRFGRGGKNVDLNYQDQNGFNKNVKVPVREFAKAYEAAKQGKVAVVDWLNNELGKTNLTPDQRLAVQQAIQSKMYWDEVNTQSKSMFGVAFEKLNDTKQQEVKQKAYEAVLPYIQGKDKQILEQVDKKFWDSLPVEEVEVEEVPGTGTQPETKTEFIPAEGGTNISNQKQLPEGPSPRLLPPMTVEEEGDFDKSEQRLFDILNNMERGLPLSEEDRYIVAQNYEWFADNGIETPEVEFSLPQEDKSIYDQFTDIEKQTFSNLDQEGQAKMIEAKKGELGVAPIEGSQEQEEVTNALPQGVESNRQLDKEYPESTRQFMNDLRDDFFVEMGMDEADYNKLSEEDKNKLDVKYQDFIESKAKEEVEAVKVEGKKKTKMPFEPMEKADFLADALIGQRINLKSLINMVGEKMLSIGKKGNPYAINWGGGTLGITDVANDLVNDSTSIFFERDAQDLAQDIADFIVSNPGGSKAYINQKMKDIEQQKLEDEEQMKKDMEEYGVDFSQLPDFKIVESLTDEEAELLYNALTDAYGDDLARLSDDLDAWEKDKDPFTPLSLIFQQTIPNVDIDSAFQGVRKIYEQAKSKREGEAKKPTPPSKTRTKQTKVKIGQAKDIDIDLGDLDVLMETDLFGGKESGKKSKSDFRKDYEAMLSAGQKELRTAAKELKAIIDRGRKEGYDEATIEKATISQRNRYNQALKQLAIIREQEKNVREGEESQQTLFMATAPVDIQKVYDKKLTAEQIEKGSVILDKFFEKGIYSFSDIAGTIQSKVNNDEKFEQMIPSLVALYGLKLNQVSDEIADKMDGRKDVRKVVQNYFDTKEQATEEVETEEGTEEGGETQAKPKRLTEAQQNAMSFKKVVEYISENYPQYKDLMTNALDVYNKIEEIKQKTSPDYVRGKYPNIVRLLYTLNFRTPNQEKVDDAVDITNKSIEIGREFIKNLPSDSELELIKKEYDEAEAKKDAETKQQIEDAKKRFEEYKRLEELNSDFKEYLEEKYNVAYAYGQVIGKLLLEGADIKQIEFAARIVQADRISNEGNEKHKDIGLEKALEIAKKVNFNFDMLKQMIGSFSLDLFEKNKTDLFLNEFSKLLNEPYYNESTGNEPNSGGVSATNIMGQTSVSDDTKGIQPNVKGGISGVEGQGDVNTSNISVSGNDAVTGGKPSSTNVSGTKPGVETVSTSGRNTGGSVTGGSTGQTSLGRGPSASNTLTQNPVGIGSNLTLDQKLTLQREAEPIEVTIQNQDGTYNEDDHTENVKKTLPIALSSQVEDVVKAEKSMFVNGNKAVLFTNGTGTGKTTTALGIVKRFVKKENARVLIVTPNQEVNKGFVNEGGWVVLSPYILESTTDVGAGKSVVITTHANWRENESLHKEKFDMIVVDESDQIMSNMAGEATKAVDALRKMANHYYFAKQEAYKNLGGPEMASLMEQLDDIDSQMMAMNKQNLDYEAYGILRGQRESILGKLNAIRNTITAEMLDEETAKVEARTKVVFLSATPFSSEKALDYAEGFLFKYPLIDGYRNQNKFLEQNFGYQLKASGNIKSGQLSADVNKGMLERAFHEALRKEGVLFRRQLDSEYDYSRNFLLLLDPDGMAGIGRMIDEGVEILEKEYKLGPVVAKKMNYLYKMRLLEAYKAKMIIPFMERMLMEGKKIVVFHNYNEGLPSHPFHFTPQDVQEVVKGDMAQYQAYMTQIRNFEEKYPQYYNLDMSGLKNPILTLTEAFGDRAVLYNGSVTNKKRTQVKNEFNFGAKDIIIIQKEAGKAGISLHDTQGIKDRILINLGLPVRSNDAIQSEGRIYRVGNMSNAAFIYPVIHTNFERFTFSEKVGPRSGTSENFALGDLARGLDVAFREGYLGAEPEITDMGLGGKEADQRVNTMTPFEAAKMHYALRGKRTKNSPMLGVDFFPTPEPIGFKMVQWADMKPGNEVLEPSAGQGSISRYFPQDVSSEIIEPSADLRSIASMLSQNPSQFNSFGYRFEDHNKINKYDRIVMNPPFGTAGNTAMKHVAQAFDHLRDGGRIVALVPTGKMVDRLNEFFYGNEARGLKPNDNAILRGVYMLPDFAFKKDAAQVNTMIIIIDKINDKEEAARVEAMGGSNLVAPNTSLKGTNNMKELFDAIENMNAPAVVDIKTLDKKPAPNTKVDSEIKAEVIKNYHKMKKRDNWVVKLSDRVSTNDYNVINAKAQSLNGYYSRYSKEGAVPGFQFENEANANQLAEFINNGYADSPSLMAYKDGQIDYPLTESEVEFRDNLVTALSNTFEGIVDEVILAPSSEWVIPMDMSSMMAQQKYPKYVMDQLAKYYEEDFHTKVGISVGVKTRKEQLEAKYPNLRFATMRTYDNYITSQVVGHIYNPNDLIPREGSQYLLDLQGEFTDSKMQILGAYYNGKIYLDPRIARPETVIHEFAHPFLDMIEQKRKDIFDKGMSLIEGTSYMDEVNSNPAYAGKTETQKKKEALVRAIHDKGAALAKNEKRGFLAWLGKFWNSIKDLLGITEVSALELSNMTLDEFTTAAVKTMFDKQAMQDLSNQKPMPSTSVESVAGSVGRDVEDYKGIFNPKKTGISGLDVLLKDDGYNYFYKGVSGEVVMMSPDEYLKRVREGLKTKEDANIIEDKKNAINESINEGNKIDMPFISTKDGKFSQEGRNRAVVARERGEKLIPVFIEKDVSFDDKIAKGQEYINSAIKDGATTKEEVISKLKKQGLHRDAILFIDNNFDDKAVEQSLKETIAGKLQNVKTDDLISLGTKVKGSLLQNKYYGLSISEENALYNQNAEYKELYNKDEAGRLTEQESARMRDIYTNETKRVASEKIAQDYQMAKENGTNQELVDAVDKLLGNKQTKQDAAQKETINQLYEKAKKDLIDEWNSQGMNLGIMPQPPTDPFSKNLFKKAVRFMYYAIKKGVKSLGEALANTGFKINDWWRNVFSKAQKAQNVTQEPVYSGDLDILAQEDTDGLIFVINELMRINPQSKVEILNELNIIQSTYQGLPEGTVSAINSLRDMARIYDFDTLKEYIMNLADREELTVGFDRNGVLQLVYNEKAEKLDLKNGFPLAQEVKKVLNDLGIKVSEKRRISGALGRFFTKTKNIELLSLMEMYTAIHEAMHFIDDKHGLTDRVLDNRGMVMDELMEVYLEYYPGAKPTHPTQLQVIEGMAVLMNEYLGDPVGTEINYPNAVKAFLKPNGKYFTEDTDRLANAMLGILDRVRRVDLPYRLQLRLADMNTVVKQQDFVRNYTWKNITPRDVGAWRWFKFQVNQMAFPKELDNLANIAYTDESLHLAFFHAQRASQIASGWLNGGSAKLNVGKKEVSFGANKGAVIYVDKKNYRFSDATVDVLLDKIYKLGERMGMDKDTALKSFDAYLIARRMQADHNKMIEAKNVLEAYKASVDMDDLSDFQQQILDRLIEDYENARAIVENDNQDIASIQATNNLFADKFKEATAIYDEINRNLLDFAKNTGLISKENYNKWKEEGDYASFQRVIFDDLDFQGQEGVGVNTSINRPGQFKQRKGNATRTFVGPMAAMIMHIPQTINRGYQNLFWKSFADYVAKYGMDYSITKNVIAEDFRYLPKKAMIVDGVPSFAHLDNKVKSGKAISFMVNGKKVYYSTAPWVQALASTMTAEVNDEFLAGMIRGSVDIFNKMTTSANPMFALQNLSVDQISTMFTTKTNKLLPVLDEAYEFAKEFKSVLNLLGKQIGIDMLTPKEMSKLEMFIRLGGGKMNLSSTYENKTIKDMITELFPDKFTPKGAVEGVIDIASIPVNLTELITRFGEFSRALDRGDSPQLALFKANQIMPFNERGVYFGSIGRTLVRGIPYANPSVRGFEKLTESMRENPKRGAIVLSILAASAVTGLLYAWAGASDEEKTKLLTTDVEVFSKYILIPDGKGGFAKIRVPEPVSAITGTAQLMAVSYLNEKEKSITNTYGKKEYAKVLMESLPFGARQAAQLGQGIVTLDSKPVGKAAIELTPQIIKPTMLTALGIKYYPEIQPIVPNYLQGKLPQYQYDKYTSNLSVNASKKLYETFGESVSPKKIDYFVEQTFGSNARFINQAFSDAGLDSRKSPFEYGSGRSWLRGREYRNFESNLKTVEQAKNSIVDVLGDVYGIEKNELKEIFNDTKITPADFKSKYKIRKLESVNKEAANSATEMYNQYKNMKDVATIVEKLSEFNNMYDDIPGDFKQQFYEMLHAYNTNPTESSEKVRNVAKRLSDMYETKMEEHKSGSVFYRELNSSRMSINKTFGFKN